MRVKIKAPSSLRGEITPPGDKSISHRAVILNSIAEGKARISNFSPGADCLSTVTCLKALGAEITEQGSNTTYEVLGRGRNGLREAVDVLDAGNSGTTIRLLTGLLAAQPFFTVITGDASLRSRPMRRVIQPLRLMGAEIWGRGNDSVAPLAIKGKELHGITYALPVPSAQLKSAIMLAALPARGTTVIEESVPSRDHTERMLRAMGAKIETEAGRITIVSSTLSPLDIRIPGDISSATYWLVAGVIHPDARIKVINSGFNPTRSGIIDVLRAMGAKIQVENERIEGGEPVADFSVESSKLTSTDIDGMIVPRLIDEIPVIALAASMARGTTRVRGAEELRVKESDRIDTTIRELSKMGAKIEELPDGMIIHGERELRGAEVDSRHDHRLAMTLGIAALVSKGETTINNSEASNISYPSFWEDLNKLSKH